MKPGTYRAIEGAIELEFDDDGDITASKEEQIQFLQKEGFNQKDIDEFIFMWFN